MRRQNGTPACLDDPDALAGLAVAGAGLREGSARGGHEDIIRDIQVTASCTHVSNTAGSLISFRISENMTPLARKATSFLHRQPVYTLLCPL